MLQNVIITADPLKQSPNIPSLLWGFLKNEHRSDCDVSCGRMINNKRIWKVMEGNDLCETSIPEFAPKGLHRTLLTSGNYMLRFYGTVFTFLPPLFGLYPEPFDPVNLIFTVFLQDRFSYHLSSTTRFNIQMVLKERLCQGVDWNASAQDSVRWRSAVLTGNWISSPVKVRNFFNSWTASTSST
jgi:hypothetical protein